MFSCSKCSIWDAKTLDFIIITLSLPHTHTHTHPSLNHYSISVKDVCVKFYLSNQNKLCFTWQCMYWFIALSRQTRPIPHFDTSINPRNTSLEMSIYDQCIIGGGGRGGYMSTTYQFNSLTKQVHIYSAQPEIFCFLQQSDHNHHSDHCHFTSFVLCPFFFHYLSHGLLESAGTSLELLNHAFLQIDDLQYKSMYFHMNTAISYTIASSCTLQ